MTTFSHVVVYVLVAINIVLLAANWWRYQRLWDLIDIWQHICLLAWLRRDWPGLAKLMTEFDPVSAERPAPRDVRAGFVLHDFSDRA